MRLVIARCRVEYTGRLSARLPTAKRLLVVKADGSVLVHADGGAYKPLNWMSPPCTLVQEPSRWRGSNRTGQTMTIDIHEVLHDSEHELGLEPGLAKDGVERDLQRLLAEHCQLLGPGLQLVRREYPTDIGPVDLLCRAADGGFVAGGGKRHGGIDGGGQPNRHLGRPRPAPRG